VPGVKTTICEDDSPASPVKPLPVKKPVVYPVPVEGQVEVAKEILINAAAPVPPAQMYPVGQGAH